MVIASHASRQLPRTVRNRRDCRRVLMSTDLGCGLCQKSFESSVEHFTDAVTVH